ncbi:MAG: hypothetical protein J6T74_00950 [Clostridia bacterium]|nr:hypothetical protein [Clostridia bacterium]
MISIDEIVATKNRLELLFNNTDNAEEKLAVKIINGNLTDLIAQLNNMTQSPQFKEMAKQFENDSKEV